MQLFWQVGSLPQSTRQSSCAQHLVPMLHAATSAQQVVSAHATQSGGNVRSPQPVVVVVIVVVPVGVVVIVVVPVGVVLVPPAPPVEEG